jgi:hypothetical protein
VSVRASFETAKIRAGVNRFRFSHPLLFFAERALQISNLEPLNSIKIEQLKNLSLHNEALTLKDYELRVGFLRDLSAINAFIYSYYLNSSIE